MAAAERWWPTAPPWSCRATSPSPASRCKSRAAAWLPPACPSAGSSRGRPRSSAHRRTRATRPRVIVDASPASPRTPPIPRARPSTSRLPMAGPGKPWTAARPGSNSLMCLDRTTRPSTRAASSSIPTIRMSCIWARARPIIYPTPWAAPMPASAFSNPPMEGRPGPSWAGRATPW